MNKEMPKNGYEMDAIYAKHVCKFTERAGVCKRVKRDLNRRFRRKFDYRVELAS